jgi:hypothetical protein
LSEEEPLHAQEYFYKVESFRKYNETYNSETGFWLRESVYNTMNITEDVVLVNWFNEKLINVFNHIYDYIKGKWPHLIIFQFMGMTPGAPAVFESPVDISNLKADAYMADLYYYDVYDNPFCLYEYVRNYKRAYPDKEFHIHLWGEEPWEIAGLAGGFEHLRRNAWITYLGGADAIGWFNWHYEKGTMWERDDTLGKRYFLYTHRINGELGKLPVFKPRPQVLVIREHMTSFQVGFCVDLGILNEWDVVSQSRLISSQMDLSQYKFIILSEEHYYDDTVEILNDYVKSGGNLVILGGFGFDQTNVFENATRTTKLLIEEGIEQVHYWGNTTMNITQPNPLGLILQYNHTHSSLLTIARNSLTENHQPIGQYVYTHDNGTTGVLLDCPLVLYHNASEPEEGWTLYWGARLSKTDFNIEYEDVVEPFLPEYNYTRYLYRTITRAFGTNFLHLNGSISVPSCENILMTQSKTQEGQIMAGISNFHSETKNINYTVDLNQYDLPDGNYCVYSVSSNRSLGWYDSIGKVLNVPLTIQANGTELLLISVDQLELSYSVKIFPDIPTEQDVEDLWPVTTTTTTTTPTSTTTSETTSEVTTITTQTTITNQWNEFQGGLLILLLSGGVLAAIVLIIYQKRKKE